MNKTIDVAGIQLDNCTVRESIMKIEKAFADDAFISVEEINMEMILQAGSDERVREALARMTYRIVGEDSILKAVNQDTMQRKYEIADDAFFYELLKRLERNHISVCLLGETEEAVTQAKTFFLQEFPRMNIMDMEILTQCTGELDNLINDINTKTPEAVISLLPSPMQEYFFLDNREKISARLWYGIGTKRPDAHRGRIAEFFRARKHMRMLLRHMMKYQEQEALKDERSI